MSVCAPHPHYSESTYIWGMPNVQTHTHTLTRIIHEHDDMSTSIEEYIIMIYHRHVRWRARTPRGTSFVSRRAKTVC